jgi:hypothetical protein
MISYPCFIIMYNVRVLDQFWTPVVQCLRTEDAVQIGNSFYLQSQSQVTTFTHNYLLRCVTFTRLTILHANIPFSHSLHNTLQIKPSQFETLAEILLRKTTPLKNWLVGLLLKNWLLRHSSSSYKPSIIQASLQQRARWQLCCITQGNAKVTRYSPTRVAGWCHRGMLRRNRIPILLRDNIVSARKSCLPAGA